MTDQEGKDWFADQYDKLIGKPLHRKELTTEEVLKRLKDSAKYRRISEAKSYKTPVPPAGTVYHLEWKDPQVTKCTCPDQDCTCKGGVMLPRRKIPRGEKYYKSPLVRKLMQRFRKPVPPPPRNFMQRLADVVGVEASIYRDLKRNDILSIRGAEFCTSRCIRYYGAGNFPNLKHLQDKQKLLKENNTAPLSDNVQDSNEDIRICDGYTCTVTTQTMIGPDGQFVFSNYSHVLFGRLDETVVRDIEGTELYISSYKCMRDNSHYATHNPCNLDNLLSWRDLINIRELKNHISLIKRNIYSSIFELKEIDSQKANVPDENLTTQCEEECMSKKSSEKISIATPYKGVIIKVKKDPHDMFNRIQEKKSQIQNSSNAMPNIIVSTNSEGLNMHLKETSPVLTEIKQDPLCKENVHCSSQIELAESKIIRDSLNQEQKQTAMQTERSSFINFTNSITKNKKSSYEKSKIQSSIPPDLPGVNSDLKSVDEKKGTVNKKDINDDSNQIDPLNNKGSQLNLRNVLQETVMSINSQKIANISRDLHENIENGEVSNQPFSKTKLFKEIKIFKDTGNEVSKSNICNFIKKRIYGLSFEHLQKIKIKNFAKSFSYTYNSDKISNNKELKSNNDLKKASKSEIKQDSSNLPCNNTTVCDENTQFESKLNSDLTNFKTTKSQLKSSLRKEDLLAFDQLKSTMDIEGNKLKQLEDSTYMNMNEVCTLDEDTAVSNDNVYKVVKTSDNKIHSVSIYKKHAELKYPNYGNDFDLSNLPQLENKNISVSESKSKVITSDDNLHDINNTVAGVTNCLENQTTKVSKNSASVIKKLSNISIHLKKLICNKIDHSIKSLPERTPLKHFKESNNARINMSEIEHRKCAKTGKKESKEEPKTSEKEVFSIQYSALLS